MRSNALPTSAAKRPVTKRLPLAAAWLLLALALSGCVLPSQVGNMLAVTSGSTAAPDLTAPPNNLDDSSATAAVVPAMDQPQAAPVPSAPPSGRVPAAPRPTIAQAGFGQPSSVPQSAGAAYPTHRGGPSVTGYSQPAVPCRHPNNACGCGGHNNAYFTSGPWNQYGIDPQEFICDGGDVPPQARVRGKDTLMGIDLEDTVVKYETEAGDKEIQASNRVCLYAPRLGAVRQVSGAVTDEHTVAAGGVIRPEGPRRIDLNQPSSAVASQRSTERNVMARGPDAFRDRDRGVPIEGVTQPVLTDEYLAALVDLSLITRGVLREADKPWLSKGSTAAVQWSHDTEVAVSIGDVKPVTQERHAAAEGLTVYDFPDAGRLRICKLADKQNALPGEIVTFLLRVDNVGDSAVSEIVITDNLTTRLEYVEESQTCSVGAEFETSENSGHSLQLTWKLTDELKVGEGANIRFKCRVR